jgi:EAL domain-containing protein (putative c-di-GMP-specific phosphodiesterase class I)
VAPHWFYAPILLAASWFGWAGALAVSVLAGLLAGPLTPLDVQAGLPQSTSDWLSRGVFFVSIGQLMAWVINRRRSAEERLQSTEETVSALRTRLSDQARDDERRRVATERIRSVLDGPGPEMVFQPIVSLEDGAVAGVEALARFHLEPQRTPDVWFAEAKEVGLGVELELVAARSALKCMGRLPQGVSLFVNLSPEAFVSPGFGELLGSVPEDRLVVEVTEHAPVEDYSAVAEPIALLRRRGGRLAIDDVGAGFASLRHIVRLGPDLVKLDIELTRNIDADPALRAPA